LDDNPSKRIEFAALYKLLISKEGLAIRNQKEASRSKFDMSHANLHVLLPSRRYYIDNSAAYSTSSSIVDSEVSVSSLSEEPLSPLSGL
jgi:hypothetical protein